MHLYLAVYLAAVSLAAICLTVYDKGAAVRGSRRVRERTLLLVSLLGGSVAMYAAMRLIRHKTKRAKFMAGIPVIMILQAATAVLITTSGLLAGNTGGTEPVQYKRITPEQAKAIMDENSPYILLDVRTDEEYNEKRIDGAVLIPDFEINNRVLTEIPDKNALILIYCRSGRRSELAAREMIELGYTNVYDFGGIINWEYDTVGMGTIK